MILVRVTSIEEAYQFSLKVEEKLNKKYDNKNSGRGHVEDLVEEGKELEEEASIEIVSTTMKKGIKHLNVLNTKEGMIEEMNGRVELQLLMKMYHILKMLKEEKFQLIEESC